MKNGKQTIVLHPPSGIAGGDHLAIAATVDTSAHAQLTTPGADRDIEAKPNLYRHTISLSAEVPLAKSLTAQAGAEFRFTQNAGHVRGETAFASIWKAGCRWSL